VRENLRQKKYQSREEFLSDINQIVENSTLYNGKKASVYFLVTIMCRLCSMCNKETLQ
jgi:transcription initiation factor TFIID subunit 1